MLYKINHLKQNHIYNPKSLSYSSLLAYICSTFKNLPPIYQLSYFDQQNDEISLASQQDFKMMNQTCNKTVKIFVKEVNEDYYDQTRQVVLDDQHLEQNIQIVNQMVQSKKYSQSNQQVQHQQQDKQSQFNQMVSSCSESQFSELAIQEKFKQLLPVFISQVKQSILKQSTVKSYIKPQIITAQINSSVYNSESIHQKIIHHNITCDQCDFDDIEGIRYKCAICANFDICEKCQIVSKHQHPFLKIKHPSQTPNTIICIINDQQENSFEMNGQRVQFPNLPFVTNIIEAFCGPIKCHRQESNQHQSQTKQNVPEQKMEEKMEQKKEQRKEIKFEQKPIQVKQEQVKTIQSQSIQKKLLIQTETIVKQVESKHNQLQKRLMQNANYVSEVLGIDYNRCYKLAVRFYNLTKEELLQTYFSDPQLIN